MACNCGEMPIEKKATTVEVSDDSGERYTGVLYSGLMDFVNWFTSSVADFHLLSNSKKVLGVSGKYSAHSLPMVGITKVENGEEVDTKRLIINLKQGNSYAYLTSSGATWKLGVEGFKFIESNKVDNVT